MSEANGFCAPEFVKVKKLLEDYVASGEELGASLYVDIEGQAVIDLHVGFTDESKTKPWTRDTKTCVFSTTKCITNLAALILADRGLLDLDAKVSSYWPEFAANGKESIEVRHILSHSSGVSGWDEALTIEEVYDLEGSAKRLEQQAPWWEPGSASGYHAITQGTMIGELVQRVTGKSLKQFIEDELTEPLGADFSLGVRESDWHRVAPVIPLPTLPFTQDPDPNSVLNKTVRSIPLKAEYANGPGYRNAALGASNGYGTAQGVAKIMSILSLGGEVDGKKFISPKIVDRVFEVQVDSVDLVDRNRYKFGMGYALPLEVDIVPEGKRCFWGGWGGSIVVMDADRKMTISYVMNKMDDENGALGTTRTQAYVKEIYSLIHELS